MSSTLKHRNEIQTGWEIRKMSDICQVISGSTPKTAVPEYWDGTVVWVTPDDLSKQKSKYLNDSKRKITDKGVEDASLTKVPKNSVIMSSRAPIGYLTLNQVEATTNQGCKTFVCGDSVYPEYLYYFLAGNMDVVKSFGAGSTFAEVGKRALENLDVTLPPKIEQKKIAEILTSIDADITKTQSVITTTETLKRALMQQLFTRGIGHTKFKKTKIGEIPEGWEVVKIKDSSIELIDGDRGVNYPQQKDFFPESFCLFLSAKNVSKKGFVFDQVNFISAEKDQELRKGKLKRGDIILTSRGTVGNVAYYHDKIPFDHVRINSGMLIVRHGVQFDPVFLYKYLCSPQMELKYLSMGSGSAQPQLPVGSLEQVEIPVLPIAEQQEIARIVSSVDEKISINKKLKAKLTLLKKGLMQDLLSGRVSVVL